MIQRWLHRYGFGIQSPWAYSLVRNVLYEPLRYYAYDELRQKYPQCSKTERKRNEQLFRIVNHFKSKDILVVGEPATATIDYIQESRPLTLLQGKEGEMSERQQESYLLYYLAPSTALSSIPTTLSDGMVLVVDDIQGTNKDAWKQLTDNAQVTAIFDMRYRGLLCCDAKRIRQTYLL